MNGIQRALLATLVMAAVPYSPAAAGQTAPRSPAGANPVVRDKFTADPAPLVVDERLYLYVGHDEAQRDEMFDMREWLVYSTTNLPSALRHLRLRSPY